ncbi:hypothetical protein BJV74DRAFT_888427 [Russula compacta]|nr:hypothetical protein BJV74DRAFT_888427 [Russula compacta]
MKRRALLVGVTYSGSTNWPQLDGPHNDVDRIRDLLITPGDHFTLFLYVSVLSNPSSIGLTATDSGHSSQRVALKDLEEEDGMNEMMITSDEDVIIDDELKEILIPPLPAILDTYHPGNLLDLPHYHCNNVYVPWQSKGERRTVAMWNTIGLSQYHDSISCADIFLVRRQAMDFANSTSKVPPSNPSVIEGHRPSDQPSHQSLEVTPLGEDRPADERELVPGAQPQTTQRPRERMLLASQIRHASPEPSISCDGWCNYSGIPHPNVLSLSACSALHRTWETPKGSLTRVLCKYLKKNNYPSYGAMMTHIIFQLHDNALALHEYTRD